MNIGLNPGPRARTVKPGLRHLRTRSDPGQNRLGPRVGTARTMLVFWKGHQSRATAPEPHREKGTANTGEVGTCSVVHCPES